MEMMVFVFEIPGASGRRHAHDFDKGKTFLTDSKILGILAARRVFLCQTSEGILMTSCQLPEYRCGARTHAPTRAHERTLMSTYNFIRHNNSLVSISLVLPRAIQIKLHPF